ncbi:MAG: hypothetical protein RLZZ630_502 [Bacteroidota bacterium]|jgi:tRNA threonylcarbamoyladenosine biosynthesis protein TsaB
MFLLLETATGMCSVALSRGEVVVQVVKAETEREHAAKLADYIRQVMDFSGVSFSDLDAVVVSRGPGSYTGLRIGVATAKGICFSCDKPLIAVDTHRAMAACFLLDHPGMNSNHDVLVPVIDARREEVYGASLGISLDYLEPVRAEVMQKGSFVSDPLKRYTVFGDAAKKCIPYFQGMDHVRIEVDYHPDARGLLIPALEAFRQESFEDVAYFEPFYLKDFIAKSPVKSST